MPVARGWEFAEYQRQTCRSAHQKTCDILSQPSVASVEALWLATTHFKKCTYLQVVLRNVIRTHYEIKIFILMHTQYLYTL